MNRFSKLGLLAGLGLALVAGLAASHPVQVHALAASLTSVVQPVADSAPAPSPSADIGTAVIAAPVPVASAAPIPDPAPTLLPAPDPVVTPPPATSYPIVQGAPCIPPGVVTSQGCIAPSTGNATAAAPASLNPAANLPGRGAPCLPPGVLVGNDCVAPLPTPTPIPTP